MNAQPAEAFFKYMFSGCTVVIVSPLFSETCRWRQTNGLRWSVRRTLWPRLWTSWKRGTKECSTLHSPRLDNFSHFLSPPKASLFTTSRSKQTYFKNMCRRVMAPGLCLCVCVCACMDVYIRVCMCVLLCMCVHACAHACVLRCLLLSSSIILCFYAKVMYM